jgi:hypothetical protein
MNNTHITPEYVAHRYACIQAIIRRNAGRGEPSHLVDEYVAEGEHGDSSYWNLFDTPDQAAVDYVVYIENRDPD